VNPQKKALKFCESKKGQVSNFLILLLKNSFYFPKIIHGNSNQFFFCKKISAHFSVKKKSPKGNSKSHSFKTMLPIGNFIFPQTGGKEHFQKFFQPPKKIF